MTNEQFLAWIERNVNRIREYVWGHDGTNGKCDCIGLIIGAWRMAGNSWPWTHGCNYTVRYLLNNLGKDQELHAGDLVFKARKPDEKGYALPDRYKSGSDKLDYYHVGVVTSVNPLCITHCTNIKGGIKRDDTRGSWHYSGRFSKLTEGVGELPDQMFVTSPNSKPVNMRKAASKTADIVARVPVGAAVDLVGITSNGWANVSYGKNKGWIMTEYLTGGDNKPIEQPETDGQENLQAENERLREALKAIIEQANTALGNVG